MILSTIYYLPLQVPNDTVLYIDPISDSIYSGALGFPSSSLSALITNFQFQGPTLLGASLEFGNGSSPYPTIIFLPGAGPPTLTYITFQSELAPSTLFKTSGNIDRTFSQLLNETLFPDPAIAPADLKRPSLEIASEVHFEGN
ncbi:hypothetical protein V5O48_006884 [Marasmius crinis-equi]|uniref:Peptidase A1 domain-containing protein n=1 Tax=Marasmius crinis-equi TaxID=585013 RepID=A0ABR3FI85_9AGAR